MKSTIKATAKQIYHFLEINRITQDQLSDLWDYHCVEGGQDSQQLYLDDISNIYTKNCHKKVSPYFLKSLVALLQDTFGFELEEEKIPRMGRRPLAIFAQLVGLILSICTLYIVLGGIAAGQSSLTLIYGAPIWLTYAVLIATLLFLGALEGTQIAIVALTEKKVSLFKKRYPRGCKAVKLVNSKELIEKYLAGRQFGVIFVVFVIAQVTSFPQINALPFTNLPIKALPNIINFLGFQLGLFGALLVLWLAQLLPQFVANKNPLLFLDIIGMNWVIRWCLWLEAIGPTRPASWLSAPQRQILNVPTSAFVKHNDIADDVFGYEIVNQSHNWKIFEDQTWSLDYSNSYRIRSHSFSTLIDSSLVVHGEVASAKFNNCLFREDVQVQDELNTQGVEARPIGNGWSRFYQEVNSDNLFQTNDVIQNHYLINGSSRPDRAQISIERPTKLITFNVEIFDKHLSSKSVFIRKLRKDDVTGQALLLNSKELNFKSVEPSFSRKASFIDVHPKMNTVYELTWFNKEANPLQAGIKITQ